MLEILEVELSEQILVGSFFSGGGGIELGLELASERYEVVWFVEKEPYPRSILRKHWGDAAIYEDITQIDLGGLPRVDVITGGFPCQDISNAGRRAGIQGSRSGLWTYFCEGIRVLRPRIAIIENVSALTGRGLDVVLADLASIGYDAEWYCFPASAVGAPHQRDRIVIIAYSNQIRRLDWESEKHSTKRRESAFNEYNGRSTPSYSGERRVQGNVQEALQGFKRFSWCKDVRGVEDIYKRSDIPEPLVRRMRDGFPNGVDRIKLLGNAVVPAWAEAIGRAILERGVF